MEIMATEFTARPFRFQQVVREGMLAIYRQTHQHGSMVRYEVVRLRVEPATTWPNGQITPEREVYPASRTWGGRAIRWKRHSGCSPGASGGRIVPRRTCHPQGDVRMLEDQNVIVLDLETLRSTDACRHCGQSQSAHYDEGACQPWQGKKPSDTIAQFSPLGWKQPPALGLSIGCYFSYATGRLHWFDRWTLEETVITLCTQRPLIVSFNGIGFDGALLRGLLLEDAAQAWAGSRPERAAGLEELHADFLDLWAQSYDLLAEIWKVDPDRKYEPSLNSLGALSQANGYGAKELDGALAPKLWAQGRYAEVIAYNVSDVLKTKALFEQVLHTGSLVRGDGRALALPRPVLPPWPTATPGTAER